MPCAHHVPATSKYPECPSGEEYETPKCAEICSDTKYSVKFDDDKHFASDAYSLRSVENIQLDMMQHGSVTAAFSVYSDFLTYKGGVYSHSAGLFLGGHAVKVCVYCVYACSHTPQLYAVLRVHFMFDTYRSSIESDAALVTCCLLCSTFTHTTVTPMLLSFLAIQIIGWGVDADTNKPYWLVVNSWNESWGEGGMFRIARGDNECGIEGQIVAGLA
jgi:Papain family cysteine protease